MTSSLHAYANVAAPLGFAWLTSSTQSTVAAFALLLVINFRKRQLSTSSLKMWRGNNRIFKNLEGQADPPGDATHFAADTTGQVGLFSAEPGPN